jgi:hypothetical protein
MLTKTDLSQIRKIVRQEVETESESAKEDLQGEIKLSRIELQKDVRSVKDRIKNLEIAVRKIQKNIKTIVNFFDKGHLQPSLSIN